MIGKLLAVLLRRTEPAAPLSAALRPGPLRLHIGGQERHPDWLVVDVIPGEHVDMLRPCTDLSPFADGSVAEIYASHVLEHLSHRTDLRIALKEFHRVLVPGGVLRVSVPDLAFLCEQFLEPSLDVRDQFNIVKMMFGAQADDADFHHVGLNEGIFREFLAQAGFSDIERIGEHGLFNDTSTAVFRGRPISLNMVARKPAAAGASAADAA